MKLSAQERDAVKIYDEVAQRRDTSDTPYWPDEFTQFAYLAAPEPGEIIDVGCRLGRMIPHLSRLGIRKYFGIDPSKESIALCRELFPDQAFEVNEIRMLGESYPVRFSGFMLFAVLMHIPPEDLQSALHSLRACLIGGSIGFLSTPFDSDQPKVVQNHVGMLLTLYSDGELEEALQAAQFQIVDKRLGEGMIRMKVVAT